jgi:hypothetical protein
MHYNMGTPVLYSGVNVYFIYYGAFSQHQRTVIENYTRGLGGLGWWRITMRYYSQADETRRRHYVGQRITVARVLHL